MNNKKVSVIMNCFNGAPYLKESLSSLQNQKYTNWELIFYDNFSSDKSKQIVKSIADNRIKYYFSNIKKPLGMARSEAFNLANGDYLGFLDTDDIWEKNKLEIQVNFLEKSKDIIMCYSNTMFFNDKKNFKLYKKKQPSGFIFEQLLKNYFISFDTILFNNRLLKKNKIKIDPDFDLVHDMDLIIRSSKNYKIGYINKILSNWRMHEVSESAGKDEIFVNEKKKLLLKYDCYYNNDIKYYKFKPFLKDKILRSEILIDIKKKKYNLVKPKLYNLKKNFKNLILILICIIPFNKSILNLLNNTYLKKINNKLN